MSQKILQPKVILATVCAITFWSCNEVKTSTRASKEENSAEACTSCETPSSNIKTSDSSADKFCEEAKQIKQASLYQQYYEQYCTEGKPSEKLRALVANAFAGSGKPKLVEFAPLNHDQSAGIASWWIAGGFSLPISAKDLISKLRAIDMMNLSRIYNPFNAGMFGLERLNRFPKEDKYHLGGEEFSVSADKIKNYPLSLGFNQRADLYEFSDKVYLYATHATMQKYFVKKLDVYVAVLDIEGKAYLVPQVAIGVQDLTQVPGFTGELLKALLEGSLANTYNFIVGLLK